VNSKSNKRRLNVSYRHQVFTVTNLQLLQVFCNTVFIFSDSKHTFTTPQSLSELEGNKNVQNIHRTYQSRRNQYTQADLLAIFLPISIFRKDYCHIHQVSMLITCSALPVLLYMPSRHTQHKFNPLRTQCTCVIKGLSAYHTVNIPLYGYKNQSVNDPSTTVVTVFPEIHTKHINAM
jgi:hypothetical protein